MEPGLEGIGLGVVLEFGQGGKPALGVGEHQGFAAGCGGEGDLDPAILRVGLPSASVQPSHRIGDDPGVLVEHPEQVSARPRRLEQAVSAAADQGARRPSAADHLDDPSAPLAPQLGEAELAGRAQERRRIPLVALFGVGDPAIQGQVRVQRPLLRQEPTEGVDLEEPDHHLGGVLERHGHGDLLVGRDGGRVGGRELDVHPVFEGLVGGR